MIDRKFFTNQGIIRQRSIKRKQSTIERVSSTIDQKIHHQPKTINYKKGVHVID